MNEYRRKLKLWEDELPEQLGLAETRI